MEARGSWEVSFSTLGYAKVGTGDVTAWTVLMLKCKGLASHAGRQNTESGRLSTERDQSGAKRAWSPATRF